MIKKRLLAFLISFAMIAQMGFVVSAEGNNVFDLGLNTIPEGSLTEFFGSEITATSTMTVMEQNDEKFVRVTDKDMSVQGGFSCSGIPLDGKTTISVDFRRFTVMNTLGSVNLYITGVGHPISLVLGSEIGYYAAASGGYVATDAVTVPEQWANLIIVINPTSKTFDLYKNGELVSGNIPFREGSSFKDTFSIRIFSGDAKQPTGFDFKNLKVIKGEITPIFDLAMDERATGDLTDYAMGATETSTVKVVDDGGDRIVKISDNDADEQGGVSTPYMSYEGKTTVSVDLRRINSSVSFYISSKNGTHPITMHLSSSITCYTGSAGGAVATGASSRTGKWDNITIVLDHSTNKFDFYKNGNLLLDDELIRSGSSFKDNQLSVRVYAAYPTSPAEFDIKNMRVFKGEVIPQVTEYFPDRTLVDFADAPARLDEVLGNAVAMTAGNSMARVNNRYERIDANDKYVAPFITDKGRIFVPARFVAEKIGCELVALSETSFRFSKDGTKMEVTVGNRTATVDGKSSTMPEAPVIKHGRLFIHPNLLAKTFGKTVFTDDRGLVVISDDSIDALEQENIIKPLINQIRQYTTLYGNTKYSDVNFSSRYYRKDGHMDGTTTPQWGTLDASKRFMATFNRWTYDNNPSTIKAVADQGLPVQGSFQPIFNDGSITDSTYYYNGIKYLRYDFAWGNLWGCVSDPRLYEYLMNAGKQYIDMGMTSFQFDDWPINANYQYGGCFCDNCVEGFAEFLSSSEVTPEELSSAGVTTPATFNYKEYIRSSIDPIYFNFTPTDNATIKRYTMEGYNKLKSINPTIDVLWQRFNFKRVVDFHHKLSDDLDKYAGEEVYYSVNSAGIAVSPKSSVYTLPLDGVMGETSPINSSAIGVFSSMLFSKAYGLDNIVSPYAGTPEATKGMYYSIPMYYATGQFFIVPWDVWLEGSTRYYTTLEELEHIYELPREYPWLFDNYEMPELVGYIYDMDNVSSISDFDKFESSWATPGEVYKSGLPARAILHYKDINKTIAANEFSGLQALIAGTDLSKISDAEKATINNSGITLVSRSDTAAMNELKSAYWMTKSSNSDVYTVLRTNQLYDNAPVVVHAVNYNDEEQKNVQIDINNFYLPEGDRITVNVYKPGRNSESFTVNRGSESTKITIDSVDRWTVLEICGPESVRREAKFDLGTGINGIGLGTRVSNDKVTGTADDFTFVTYSEGINSTTYNDVTGNQDEAAFVYKRLGKGALDDAYVSARFSDSEGSYGVMAREGVYSNAKFAALVYDPEKGLRLAVREEANTAVAYTDISSDRPSYMKLENQGDKYVAYVSDDGNDYEEVGRIFLALDETVAGVFASSSNGSYSECRVRDLDIFVPVCDLDVLTIDIDGEDFVGADYINKAGEATINISLKNNTSDSIAPAIMAATYNSGRLVSLDIIKERTQIAGNSANTFELSVTIPDRTEKGTLEFFVFEDMDSAAPLISAVKKSIKTN